MRRDSYQDNLARETYDSNAGETLSGSRLSWRLAGLSIQNSASATHPPWSTPSGGGRTASLANLCNTCLRSMLPRYGKSSRFSSNDVIRSNNSTRDDSDESWNDREHHFRPSLVLWISKWNYNRKSTIGMNTTISCEHSQPTYRQF